MLVFDGVGRDETLGPLRVRFAADADALLERLAAENRDREPVCLVSSDFAVRGTPGQEVRTTSSRIFLAELEAAPRDGRAAAGARRPAGRGDVRERLERLRRGQYG